MPTPFPEINILSKKMDLKNHRLVVLLENIRSAYNVGSIIRTAESAGVDQLYLTGYTPIPPHPKLGKTALGASRYLPWSHHCDAVSCARWLQTQDICLVACETAHQAVDIFTAGFQKDTCLVFGHEETGISPYLLEICQEVVSIPQLGHKDSLNVAVAAGIAVYEYHRKRVHRATH